MTWLSRARMRRESASAARTGPANVVLDLNHGDPVSHAAKTSKYLPYRYDIGGVTTIGSQVPLRELEYFRAPWLGHGYDLEIRVGEVGAGWRRRALVHRTVAPLSVSYEEHIGRLGANFRVEMSNPIRVTCGPLLAKSPHVLYTNVVEALLRFLAVSRGRMLLHSACLEIDGRGLLLSARTDTGKTGTILRLLREQRGNFLSDDMTIIAPNGVASCYPKPLTISQHTLRAVQADDLSAREWRKLRLQSRLHSKEGRQFGTMLADLNLPIMSINAITQLVVPPPKYPADRLVPCDITPSVNVDQLFIIERGAPSLTTLSTEEALDELIENTDDAYGFPPFRYFAPALVIGDDDYERLRRRERELLSSALRRMRLNRLASDCFGWADEIPPLLRGTTAPRLPVPSQVVTPVVTVPQPATNGHSNGNGHAHSNGHSNGNGHAHSNGHSNGNGHANGNGNGNGHLPETTAFEPYPLDVSGDGSGTAYRGRGAGGDVA